MRLITDEGAGAAEGLALDEALMARYARGQPGQPPTLRLYTYRSHCALVERQAFGGTGTVVGDQPHVPTSTFV